MPRFIARIILTLALAPFMLVATALITGLLTTYLRQSWLEDIVVVSVVMIAFVLSGFLFFLIWRGVVPWIPARSRRTLLASAFATVLIASLPFLWRMAGVRASFDWTPITILSGAAVSFAWVIFCCIVWQEKPRERLRRVQTAAASTSNCPMCRYDMGGLSNLHCPECGQKYTLGEFQDAQRRGVSPKELD